MTWLDVFTATPLQGNPLPVVVDGDGLDDTTMLAFTRETGQVETTFVQAPTVADATYRNRIWDAEGEMSFAGHPSLGTAVAVARAGGERAAEYVQQTPAGLQVVAVEVRDDDLARASVVQEPAEFGPELDPAVPLRAVGIDPASARQDVPAQVVWTGTQHLQCLVGDRDALTTTAPDAAALRALQDEHGVTAVYVSWWDGGQAARARSFFAVDGRWGEDAATGSAAGPLLALLHARFGAERLEVEQGVELGRRSVLSCDLTGGRVRVAGDVVVVAEGAVRL